MKKGQKIVTFAICLIIAFIPAIAGYLTNASVNSSWYEQIRPSLTPPGWVFPIVWNILFLLLGISLYLAWTSSKNKKQKTKVAWVFGINLFLNFMWSIFYFGMKNPLLSFIDIIPLWISILAIIIYTRKINKTAAYITIPYLLWVSFASYLNYISILNWLKL